MPYTTLVSVLDLAKESDTPDWIIFDCRFSLTNKDLGRDKYLEAHIPGALYADLESDLSGPIVPGKTGRHPLPSQAAVEATFSRWGIAPESQVVVYDDSGGSIAARLWWMLKWQGHTAAAVLDGGWQAWNAAGLPTRSGNESRAEARFQANPDPARLATMEDVERESGNPEAILIDARAPERFRGEVEPLDRIAGRIPGARNSYHMDTIDPDGKYLSSQRLRRRFEELLEGSQPEKAILYCGSGVSAAQNLLALEHAGMPGAKLYVGSWSEWITDPSHPIAAGPEEGRKG